MTLAVSPAETASARGIAPAEWDARVKLAACYRLMAHFGVADLTYNHLSARVPDVPHHYLIKSEDQLFEEVTASSILTYGLDGQKVHAIPGSVSRGGLVIHAGVLEHRPDIMAVFHTHTAANMAVSAQTFGLLPLTQHAVRFYERIGYHDFGGFEFEIEGRRRLAADLEGKLVLMMRNHGVLVCGTSIPQAFIVHHFLEMACRAQVGALAAGRENVACVPHDVATYGRDQMERVVCDDEHGRDWRALLRLAERLDPAFRS